MSKTQVLKTQALKKQVSKKKEKVLNKANKEKVGKSARDLLLKEPEERNPIALTQEMLKDYEKNVYECVQRGRKENDSDFYIIVLTKKERLMPNVLRNYFFFRKTCPTPNYDQILYRYYYNEDRLEFLWVIPARDICYHLLNNSTFVHPSERGLLKYVFEFKHGILYRLCKKLNSEKAGSNILDK